MDRREMLKTILTTDMTGDTKGGLMLQEQADKFIDLTLDFTTMLKIVRDERKRRDKGELDLLNIGSVVTEGADEEPDDPIWASEEVKPTFSKLEWDTKKLRSIFNITTDTLLDNIESEAEVFEQRGEEPPTDFREKLMAAYAKRISTDIELLAIQGDTSLAATSKLNRLLRHNQGWDKLTDTGCHYVNAGYTNVSVKMFSDMLKQMPSPYLKQINELRWFMGPLTYINWCELISRRLTQTGDDALKGMAVAPFGIPAVMVPLIPEDKESTVGTTTYDALSFMWLTFPENFVHVFRRRIETYWEFKPRRDRWENTTYSETDTMVENFDAIVKAYNLKVDSTSEYGS